MQSPFYRRILKETILFSVFQNPSKKIRETRTLKSIPEHHFVERKTEGRNQTKTRVREDSSLCPKTLTKNAVQFHLRMVSKLLAKSGFGSERYPGIFLIRIQIGAPWNWIFLEMHSTNKHRENCSPNKWFFIFALLAFSYYSEIWLGNPNADPDPPKIRGSMRIRIQVQKNLSRCNTDPGSRWPETTFRNGRTLLSERLRVFCPALQAEDISGIP